MSATTPDPMRTARTSRLLREIIGTDAPVPHRGLRETISWSVLVPGLFVITFVGILWLELPSVLHNGESASAGHQESAATQIANVGATDPSLPSAEQALRARPADIETADVSTF